MNNHITDANALAGLPLRQEAEKIVNIGSAHNINNTINFSSAKSLLSPNSFYNLIIKSGEKYEEPHCIMYRDRVLEFTTPQLCRKLSNFTFEDIEEIINLPSLFLPEVEYEITGEQKRGQIGFWGKIKEIHIWPDSSYDVSFEIEKEGEIELDRIIEFSNELGLKIDGYEHRRTHWAIKRADLMSVIKKIKG